jgi:hypothetical protein
MSSLTISGIVLVCIFGSGALGVALRPRFPDEHLSADTKDVVKLVMGIVGTMTGMVLGLLVASAKSSFDSQRSGVAQLAANVVVLDRVLAHYGPETRETRGVLRDSVTDMIQRIWPSKHSPSDEPASSAGNEGRYDELYDRVLSLAPKTDAQRTTQAQALKIVHDTGQMRWLLYSQRSNSIPLVFLVLMVSWLAITFACYGLYAPRHATTFVVLFLGAFVISSAVFLILELDHAFSGIIHISSQPLRNALAQLGR